jgi:hypothetical protein
MIEECVKDKGEDVSCVCPTVRGTPGDLPRPRAPTDHLLWL